MPDAVGVAARPLSPGVTRIPDMWPTTPVRVVSAARRLPARKAECSLQHLVAREVGAGDIALRHDAVHVRPFGCDQLRRGVVLLASMSHPMIRLSR